MRIEIKVLVFFIALGSSCGLCYSQKVQRPNNDLLVGQYDAGREVIYINQDNSFYVKRTERVDDVMMPGCNDTVGKGKWQVLREDVLMLKNFPDYNKILFDVKQVRKFCDDSIYIKIQLPVNDAFYKGRFEFGFFFSDGIGNFQSTNDYIVLPKVNVTRNNVCNFSLSIKDVYPNCSAGKKCYQRIYFKVFETLKKDISLNYIFISLPNFDECFVELQDLDNDLLYFNSSNNILWRGKEYKRPKNAN